MRNFTFMRRNKRLFPILYYAKIDFWIVIVLIITLKLIDDIDKRCGFVANTFSITNILETTPARKPKVFCKSYEELKHLQNNYNIKKL